MADTQPETGLPPNWEVRHSNSKNLPYYFNSNDRNSRWEPPPGTDTEKLKVYMAKFHSPNAGSGAANNGGGADSGKIRAAHLLVKHNQSRRPMSWKEKSIECGETSTVCRVAVSWDLGAYARLWDSADGVNHCGCEHICEAERGRKAAARWHETGMTRSYSNITRGKDDAQKIIEAHQDRIKSGEISLGDLAVTESDCSSARKRGDLGYFGRGDMQKEFEDAAFALQPGEISGVVDTASGLHLIERLE